MAALSTASVPACVRVGELACQQNSFLRELTAHVVSCAPSRAPAGGGSPGSPGSPGAALYDVHLTDSVLFPEGGGQPCDYGELTRLSARGGPAVPVRRVQRRGDACVLSVPCALAAGEAVRLRVDWPRRLDHMQQHSAQHLLSAVVERREVCGLPTVSWSLTHPYCFIVLPTSAQLEAAVVEEIEDRCNEAIARAVPVRCDVYASKEEYQSKMQEKEEEAQRVEKVSEEDAGGSPAEAAETRSRGIPTDVTGPIRIITIEDGFDSCTCCGTHVSNLAQLHMVKLLHQETKGDTVKLYFAAGERARRNFGAMYQRERELMRDLGGVRPENFVSAVVKKNRDSVEMEKRIKALKLELAQLEGERLIAAARKNSGGVLLCRRDDVDGDFFTAVRSCLAESLSEPTAVFAWATGAAVRGEVQPGQFMIIGTTEAIEQLTPVVTAALEGKGGLSKAGYRGKGNLKGWDALAEKIREMKIQ